MIHYFFAFAIASFLCASCSKHGTISSNENPPVSNTPPPNDSLINLSNWKMVWNDEFDYPDNLLENKWISQNAGYASSVLLCSRWRDNVKVHDGILELINKKEKRGGYDWTSGSIWTKEQFGYGYYEARYKYAGATGTNNSFWLWPQTGAPAGEKKFELDINEGHYPNEVNTNIHNWTDTWVENGVTKHQDDQQHHAIGMKADVAHTLNTPVTTKKVRFTSNNGSHFHIREFRIYAPNAAGYPKNVLSETADTDVTGLINHARAAGTTITASGTYNAQNAIPQNVADGKVAAGSWISQASGEKWLQFEWTENKTIGTIQFINGWKSGFHWNSLISDYKIQYHNGTSWVDMVDFDVKKEYDFSKDYHTYGLEWNDKGFKFYFDRKLIRTEKNTLAHGKLNILLSLAILNMGIAGEVTDAIDGTSMKVDYVRYYQKK